MIKTSSTDMKPGRSPIAAGRPESSASPRRPAETYEIEVFYDGDCPLCLREIAMLKRMDRRQLIRFTDIAAPEFSPDAVGKSFDELMAEIHGRLPDGQWLVGMEVFRRLYSAAGFGWLVGVTRWPVVRQVCDWSYRVFARNRLKLTGRCTTACGINRSGR